MEVVLVVESEIPKKWVLRCLDDTTAVSPEGSGLCEKFSEVYPKNCEKVNIQLAEICPNNEKSFVNQTSGVVLGIHFNSKKMEWSLPAEKANDSQLKMFKIIDSEYSSLKQIQSANGCLNSLAQICPLAAAFRAPANAFAGSFNNNETILKKIPDQVKKDFRVVIKMVESAKFGLPIAHKPAGIPLFPVLFISDAAGSSFVMCNKKRTNNSVPGDRGVASIALDSDFSCVFAWPDSLFSC